MGLRKIFLQLASIGLAVLLASVTALIGVEDEARAAFPGQNGKIIYTAHEFAKYPDIYTMDSDGSNQNRFTSDPGNEGSAAWSPDGSRIAFLSQENRDKATCYSYEIYIAKADGSSLTRLTNDAHCELSLDWSPDGSKIVFTRAEARNDQSFNVGLYTMNADGSDQKRITPAGTDAGANSSTAWSPDGSKIVFTLKDDIYTIDPSGAGLNRLTSSPGLEYLPDWSPDGSKIAFTKQTNPEAGYFYEAEIYTMNPDGSNQTHLTDNSGGSIEFPRIDYRPIWSPDGSMIAFTRREGHTHLNNFNQDIFTMNEDGSNLTRITSDSSLQEYAEDWQPLPGPTVPETKADCKNGGWRDFGYRNQGQCIKAVNATN